MDYIQCLTGLDKQIHELLAEFRHSSVKINIFFPIISRSWHSTFSKNISMWI